MNPRRVNEIVAGIADVAESKIAMLNFAPLLYVLETVTWFRLVAIAIAATGFALLVSGPGVMIEKVGRLPFCYIAAAVLYATVMILIAQIGEPRFRFAQIIPSAFVLAAFVSIGFISGIHFLGEKIDWAFALIAGIFATLIFGIFFLVIFGLLPRLLPFGR